MSRSIRVVGLCPCCLATTLPYRYTSGWPGSCPAGCGSAFACDLVKADAAARVVREIKAKRAAHLRRSRAAQKARGEVCS